MEQTMKQSQSGFTMLEVLVSILIMAIGMLGLAGLMAASMRNNHGAYHRTQAVWLAYDVADRMRANRQNALAGSYNIALGAVAPGGGAINAVDLTQWLNAVSALPQGLGAVNVAGGAVTITVQWNDTRATGGGAAQQFQMQTRL
jgi:type IV pilus assembly protein PilV